jgi:CheY-like chemotaxis protein
MSDRSQTKMILLVEDHAALRELLAERLRSLGHDVVAAGTVAEAIPLLERTRVDVILSDHSMPGATGLELLAYVHFRMPDIPFVLMSAEVTPEMESAASSAGAAGVIAKDDLQRRMHVHFPATSRASPRRERAAA